MSNWYTGETCKECGDKLATDGTAIWCTGGCGSRLIVKYDKEVPKE